MRGKIEALFERLPISFTANALIYPILFIASLVFAQAMKTPLSHTVFVFILLLPLGALLQIAAAVISVRVSVRLSQTTVEKKAVVSLFANVTNKGPFPLAFVEAVLLLPGEHISQCDKTHTMMTLLPFSSAQLTRGVEFTRRGEYDVGVSHIYVYDLTRSVRVRVKLNKTRTVFVLPRRLSLPSKTANCEEYVLGASANLHSLDAAEAADTRIYTVGDSLKRVHWKLSSKSEELIVREGSSRRGADVCVMCDLEPYYMSSREDALRTPEEKIAHEIDYILADAVIEMALALALREVRSQNTVMLVWIEKGECVSVRLNSLDDYESVFRRLGTAELDTTPGHISRILECTDIGDALPIAVCPCLTSERAGEYAARLGKGARLGAPTLLLFEDERLFLPDKAAQSALDERVSKLFDAGFDVIKFKP